MDEKVEPLDRRQAIFLTLVFDRPPSPDQFNVESDAAWTPVRMEEKVERHDAGAPLAQH